MDKLKALLKRCKYGAYISIDSHRILGISVEQAIQTAYDFGIDWNVSDDVLAKMIEADTVVIIVYYPNSDEEPWKCWHHDLDAALDAALASLPPAP